MDLRDKTMSDKLMFILNDDTHNYPFNGLQLEVQTFGHSTYDQPIITQYLKRNL